MSLRSQQYMPILNIELSIRFKPMALIYKTCYKQLQTIVSVNLSKIKPLWFVECANLN